MPPSIAGLRLAPLPGAVPAWRASVDSDGWRRVCEAVAGSGGRLGALWASDERDRGAGFALHAVLVAFEGLVCVDVRLEGETYADVSDLFPAAGRMQRAIADLMGLRAGMRDTRGWLRHGAWREDAFPLRRDVALDARLPAGDPRYAFVPVEGEGVHEIPVGPVHAGIIEPGHFRFSIVGEKILRLEERLGYTHKGIEKRFETMTLEEGARLAGRVSGDSTVAYAWAWAMAVEGATGTEPPPRATALRGVLLELERIANHLGDLGYLGNDVALSFGFFQFWRLKEDLLRSLAQLFGHRYLMDAIVPGGVAKDLPRGAGESLTAHLERIEREVATLKSIYDEHAGAQDRFIMTGQVTPALAERMGLTGLAGRASGIARDLRVDYAIPPYQQLDPRAASHTRGDVAARVAVRFDEVFESMRLVQALVQQLPPGDIRASVAAAAAGARGLGWIEGWRGEVLIALETAAANRIHRLHPHDPSWQNWPLLEHAVHGNIVPDFPLINKSFNLSYSGVDL